MGDLFHKTDFLFIEPSMNRPLKIDLTKHKCWFGTDFHLQHKSERVRVWEKRGYSSIYEHDAKIIEITNSCVGPNDYLIHLGDFSLNTSPDEWHQLLSRFRCQNIFYLWGNHNRPAWQIYQEYCKKISVIEGSGEPLEPSSKNWLKDSMDNANKFTFEIYPLRYKNVIFVGNYLELEVDNQKIICSHYPYSIHDDARKNAWNLCGHSHYSHVFSQEEYKDNLVLDIAWEKYRKPLSFEEIREIMKTKRFVSSDHHK